MLFEDLTINYVHPGLGIGLQNIRNAWLLENKPVKLTTTLHRGSLIYRIPGSAKRISYRTLKKGLIKKQLIIRQPLQLLPF
jgi:hypothetical protein